MNDTLASHILDLITAEYRPHKDDPAPTHLNIFDFDNTLFKSPEVNKNLWDATFAGALVQDDVVSIGWWRDIRSLQVDDDLEMLRRTKWEGWWNEEVVASIRKSMELPTALTVLLTGRRVVPFLPLIRDIVKSKGLIFNIIGLKPEPPNTISLFYPSTMDLSPYNICFPSTLDFKLAFISYTIARYSTIQHLQVWEDRSPHILKLQSFIDELLLKGSLVSGHVIPVKDQRGILPVKLERRIVNEMVAEHNHRFQDPAEKMKYKKFLASKKPKSALHSIMYSPIELVPITQYLGLFFTAYDTETLLETLLPCCETYKEEENNEWVMSGDHVTICLGHPNDKLLATVGGLGATLDVECVALGNFEGQCWATKVIDLNIPPEKNFSEESLDNISKFSPYLVTNNAVPHITLAYRPCRGAKPSDSNKIAADSWRPLPTDLRLRLKGTVRLLQKEGIKSHKKQLSIIRKQQISIGNLIHKIFDKELLPGRYFGTVVEQVKENMEKEGVKNERGMEDKVEAIIQKIKESWINERKGNIN